MKIKKIERLLKIILYVNFYVEHNLNSSIILGYIVERYEKFIKR